MKIGLFGSGAYGMAISSILIDNHCEVTMWTKMEEEKKELEKTRMNEKRIPGFKLDSSIKLTTSVEECIKDKDLLIIAIPAAFVIPIPPKSANFMKIASSDNAAAIPINPTSILLGLI